MDDFGKATEFLELEQVVSRSSLDVANGAGVSDFYESEDLNSDFGSNENRLSLAREEEAVFAIPDIMEKQFASIHQAIDASHQHTNRLASLCHNYCRSRDSELARLRVENSELREQLGHPGMQTRNAQPEGMDASVRAVQECSVHRNPAEDFTFGVIPEYRPPEVGKAPLPAEGAPILHPPGVSVRRFCEAENDMESIPMTETDASKVANNKRCTVEPPAIPSLNTLVEEDEAKHERHSGFLAPLNSVKSSEHALRPLLTQNTTHTLKVAPKSPHRGKFEVVPVWKKVARSTSSVPKQSTVKKLGKGRHANSLFQRAVQRSGAVDIEVVEDNIKRERYSAVESLIVIHPNSPRRGVWDILSLFLVVYDMIYIPLQFFDPPEVPFTVFMSWLTRLFWTLDIVLSFTTGFVSNDGFVVLNFSKIVRRYLKSWFLLDFIVVGSDWIEIILSAGGNLGFARLGKASRTIRIIRMLRLLRLARMREVLAVVSERIYSEKVVIFADIFKILIIVVGLAHFIACLWYGLGISENLGWVEESGFTRKSLGIRYAMSLHWSIAQFAGGMDEVTPASLNERVFAICMFILAFIISGVFVSSITSSMTQLNIIGSHQTQHLSILRRYLHQNGIPNKLAMRVQRNAQYAVTEQQRMLPEQSVKYLQMVSEPLRVEIHLEMYAPIFMIHPFFETYLSECPQVMRKVCHLATSTMNLSAGDVIFSAGETPAQPKMYIVNVGCLEYCHLNGERVPIEEGTCISEACLWCHWVHQGVLTAATDARLCVVDAKKFQSIAHQFEHNEFDPKVYANDFVNTLNSVQDPSDVADHHPELHADMLEEKRLQEANYEITGFWAKSPLAGYLARRKKRQNEKRIQSELKRTMTQHAPRVSGPVRVASNPRTA